MHVCGLWLPADLSAGLPEHPAQAAAAVGHCLLPALHQGPPGEGPGVFTVLHF
jgi:hypothetical protein